MIEDDKVVEESGDFVRIIIRRPQAYAFRRMHREAPIPGFGVMDGEGKWKGAFSFGGDDAAARLAKQLKKLRE